MQPQQVAARSLRQGRGRIGRLGRRVLLASARRSPAAQRGRQCAPRSQGGGGQPLLRLGQRPCARRPARGHHHLRGPRQGFHPAVARGARPHPGDLRRPGPSGVDRPPAQAGHHRGRAVAHPPVRPRPLAGRQGPDQLLGLQLHRLPRSAQRLCRLGRHGWPGPGVSPSRQGHARRRHRGDPRRRLQPHRRRRPQRSHAGLQGDRQRRLLPPRGERPHPLPGLHRHGELDEHAAPARAAADHGLAALLGDRDARRRVPLRPGRHPRPRAPRGRPALGLLRPDPAGPGRVAGQAHRRALGRGGGRLPGRQLPAVVVGVERPVPRHGA